jgi:hypothetical protein
MDPRRLTLLLRSSTGFTASDLDYIQAGVLKEAKVAEDEGRLDRALERYAYLVLNQAALSRGGHGAKVEERRVALDRLSELYERGDETTHAYLWSLVRTKPDALYPAENLWKVLLESVGPRVRPEDANHGPR